MPDLETSLAYCTYCPKLCRHTCPVSHAEARETLTPTTKMATMRRLRMYEGDRSVESSEPLYGCTGCGACTEFCLHDIEVGPALFRGRDDAERERRGHPALAGFVARFTAHDQRAAAQVREHVPAERRPLEAQVAFMPGCEAPELGASMLAVCDRVGAEYVGVAETRYACGGYPLLAAGQHDAFRMHAERVAGELANYKRVVMHCPACAWTMKTQYAAVGVPLKPQIDHTTEFLSSFAERLPIKRTRESAFYHDPCYLGRYQNLYDPPRKLASKAVSSLREFSRSRGEAECSGGGGLLPVTMPSTAESIAETRLTEVREAGATTVVTSCSSCKRQLTRGGVTAIDLVDLLAEAVKTD
jgi:Fe-S oxidoreductase